MGYYIYNKNGKKEYGPYKSYAYAMEQASDVYPNSNSFIIKNEGLKIKNPVMLKLGGKFKVVFKVGRGTKPVTQNVFAKSPFKALIKAVRKYPKLENYHPSEGRAILFPRKKKK